MAKTFKQLQDEVLQWMADENDAGLMRNLVKQAIDKCQRKILTSEQLDFMLSPLMTLTVGTSGKVYPLPENFLSMLYVKDATSGGYLEEIPGKSVIEAEEGLASPGDLSRFMITSVDNVKQQPTTAGVVVVTTTGGSEATANGIIVQGLDANGVWREEALTGTSWTTLTGSTVFAQITNVIKTGATWTRTITVTVGSVTVLVLSASEWTKQYQQLELLNTPTSSVTLQYRYFVKPVDLVYDYQPPQVPDAFRDLLVYDALLLLPGFIRSTTEELQSFERQRAELYTQLKQNYQQAKSLGARARRVRMVDRV